MSDADLDRAGQRMVRHAWVILGYVPLPEMTAAEVEAQLRFRVRQATHDPADDGDDPDD